MKKTFYLSEFKANNDTERFALAMSALRENPHSTLIVEPGVYTITSTLARETQAAVMNGDYGTNPQNVMFKPNYVYDSGLSFKGQIGTRMIADGVIFEIDGFMQPVSLIDCDDVTVSGFTIRHKRKPYSKATIRNIGKADENGTAKCDLVFDDDCPINEKTPLALRDAVVDPVTEEASYWSVKNVEYVSHHLCRAELVYADRFKDGFEYYTVHTMHGRPAILIERAKNIVLENVTINNHPGMGIVGNRSENILIRDLHVVPVRGDHFSTNTDATHFTSITGTLRLENCVSKSHGDDFTNVHAYYQTIIRRGNDNTVFLQEKTPDGTHAQTLDYPDVGDTLELTDKDTMEVLDTFCVTACERFDDDWMCKVTLDHALPENTDNLQLADITRLPRLEVVGCKTKNHFGRAVLAKCRSGLIENNTFDTSQGPAIKLGAESYWHEGVCPAHFVVRGNKIINCGRYFGNASAVSIIAEAPNAVGQTIYDITIENNEIIAIEKNGIYARNVKGLKIRNNIFKTKDAAIKLDHCTDVEID